MQARSRRSLGSRIAGLEWRRMAGSLWDRGYARSERALLTALECADVVAMYPDDRLFRSRVDMSRQRFGEGEYKYFARPLPAIVDDLRNRLYPFAAPIANAWHEALNAGHGGSTEPLLGIRPPPAFTPSLAGF